VVTVERRNGLWVLFDKDLGFILGEEITSFFYVERSG